MAEMSARSTLKAWIKDAIQGQDEISIPDLTQQAIDQFSSNIDFLRLLARESIPAMVAAESRAVMSQNRYIFFGNRVTTRENLPHFIANSVEDLKDKAGPVIRSSEVQSPFVRWFEHVGNRHINLKAMTRGDLIRAADERETRGRKELGKAWFLRRLANDLTGTQTVGERFSDDEIRAVWDNAESQTESQEKAVV